MKTSDYDIFFISYRESNAEANWQRVLSLHSDAKRIHGVKGIDRIHLACNSLATTEFFWTIDGDNWLVESLTYTEKIDVDLVMFNAYDGVTHEPSSLGAVKLWRKDSFINKDMSRGDFTLNATKTKRMESKCLSYSDYNSSPFDAWRAAFRHCVKLLSVILAERSKDNREMYLNRWRKSQTSTRLYANWAYRGYLDATEYAEQHYDNITELNKINDYDWLEGYFHKIHGKTSFIQNT